MGNAARARRCFPDWADQIDDYCVDELHRATFPGDAPGVRTARLWLWAYIECHPRRDDIALVAAELAANAVQHTASQESQFALSVEHEETGTRVAVEDEGSPDSKPELCPPRDGTVGGRGLMLVDALTDAWGHDADGEYYWGRQVWAWWDSPGARLST